jgi:hypothetical protein
MEMNLKQVLDMYVFISMSMSTVTMGTARSPGFLSFFKSFSVMSLLFASYNSLYPLRIIRYIPFRSYSFRFYSLHKIFVRFYLFLFASICFYLLLFASIRHLSYSFRIQNFPIRFEANKSKSNPSIRNFT